MGDLTLPWPIEAREFWPAHAKIKIKRSVVRINCKNYKKYFFDGEASQIFNNLLRSLSWSRSIRQYMSTKLQSISWPTQSLFSTLSVISWKMPSPILSHFWDHLPYRTSRLVEPPLCPVPWGFNVPNLMGIKRRMTDIGNWKCTDFPAFAFKVCKKCYYDFHKCWFQIRWCRLKKIPLKRLCQIWVILYLHIF